MSNTITHNATATYFSLTDLFYATNYENAIIILDGNSDKYISLIDSAAHYFRLILEEEFHYIDGFYTLNNVSRSDINTKELNYWVTHFIEQQFITKTTKILSLLQRPLQQGGLTSYRWDYKSSWKPFTETSTPEIMRALWQLTHVHKMMKNSGIKALLTAVHNNVDQKKLYFPSKQECDHLSAAVDAASIIYPKKTFCLAWATTFVLLALKKNWACSLVIGVQTNPFYAHAWAECNDNVINDDPTVAQVLSVIYKHPHIQVQ